MKTIFKKLLKTYWYKSPYIIIKHRQYVNKVRVKYNYEAPLPSIVCSSCIGGFIYHNLGLKFMSPTINLWIDTKEFVTFVCNLEKYLSLEMEFEEGTNYPIGKLGDIKIHFNHYKSNYEALSKWEERKQRIDLNNLFIITSDERLSDDEIAYLNQVQCKRLIIFTALNKSYLENTFQMKRYECNGYIGQYCVRDLDGFREFEKVFDYAKWLNGESLKKIAFIFPPVLPMPPVKGGAAETLINHILKYNETTKDFDITVFCIADNDAIKAAENYKQTHFRYIPKNNFSDKSYQLFQKIVCKIFGISLLSNRRYIKKVKRALLKENYETLIIENAQNFILPIKSVRSNLCYHLHNDFLYKGIKNADLILSACDSILAVSEYIKEQVLTINIAYEEKINVLENCIDTEMFYCNNKSPSVDDIRRKYDISDDCCLFIYSGRIIEQKGIRELLEAFKNVRGNVKLMVVGETWYSSATVTSYREEVMQLAKEMSGQIIFTGYIDYEKMPAYYAAADVCVVPSIVKEGSPLVINEALCCGLPLIATNSGGIPEKLTDTCSIIVECGITMVEELTSAMQYLYDNSDLRISMGAEGRKLMESKNVENYYFAFKESLK